MAVGGGDDVAGGDAAAVCKRQEFKGQGQRHVPPAKIPKDFRYNSYPPTSGYHDPQPAVWDVYTEPVAQRHLIHNLEHGGIVVQYGSDVSPETINRIVAWYREDPVAMVVAPFPDVPKAEKYRNKIVLEAWTGRATAITDETQQLDPSDERPQRGHLATCSRFDEEAFSDFRDDYRSKGPEPYRPGQLHPGM